MKRSPPKGFTLFLVIGIMALISMAMVTVTALNNVMAIRTDRLYLQACVRNMKASAWAWSNRNADQLAEKLSEGPMSLETETLKIPGGRLVLTLDSALDVTGRLQVTMGCSKRKVTLNRNANFPISGAD